LQKHNGQDWWPEGFEPVECRAEVEYLWFYFISMQARRKPGEALTYTEVKAWADLRDIRLERFETDALDALEAIYLYYSTKRAQRLAEESAERMKNRGH
jgi:hypothetical protein